MAPAATQRLHAELSQLNGLFTFGKRAVYRW
jgi:hypothetical protein